MQSLIIMHLTQFFSFRIKLRDIGTLGMFILEKRKAAPEFVILINFLNVQKKLWYRNHQHKYTCLPD